MARAPRELNENGTRNQVPGRLRQWSMVGRGAREGERGADGGIWEICEKAKGLIKIQKEGD